jgi:hypothetical protein
MSLQLAAQHLSDQGRGPDTSLVHMSPRELKSLSDLAMAHGHQLTINPETGLPEAGVLDKLLPTLIGAGISYFSGGTINPAMIGLGIGGLQTARTGSLEKGLMAGLGAYGGAGLTAGFMDTGASLAAQTLGAENASTAATLGADSSARDILLARNSAPAMEAISPMGSLTAGARAAADAPMDFFKNNYGKIGMAMSPIMADMAVQTKTPVPAQSPSYIRPYQMRRTVRQPEANIGSREQNWFDTEWSPGTPYKAANGGIVSLAGGGAVSFAGGGMTSQDAYDFLMGKPTTTPTQTTTKAPTYEGHYEFDTATGTTKWIPARMDTTDATDIEDKPTSVVQAPTGGGYSSNQGNQTPGTSGLPTSLVDGGGKITPLAVPSLALSKMGDAITNTLGYIAYKMDGPRQGEPAPISDSLTFNDSPNFTQVEGVPTPGDTGVTTSGLASLSGINGPGVPSTTPGNAVSSAMGGQSAAATGTTGGGTTGGTPGAPALGVNSGGGYAVPGGGTTGGGTTGGGTTGGGTTGGGTTGGAPGAPGLGVSSGGGFGVTGPGGTAGVGGTGGGGGGGGGGGCCFIMLEARYGNGTMDRVVRRYRDEKATEQNKRGYYKLAEVFVPLMRKSKLFSAFVVLTFADPAVHYAKWYYGENKWGWVFTPLRKFWLGLFDTLGSDTKFIRENGEVV